MPPSAWANNADVDLPELLKRCLHQLLTALCIENIRRYSSRSSTTAFNVGHDRLRVCWPVR